MTTDPRAVKALLPYLGNVRTFAEPCCGERDLVHQLSDGGLVCRFAADIRHSPSTDAMAVQFVDQQVDAIITNPPWTRQILHPMIVHFCSQKPTWLLFDSDWAYTAQARPYLAMCSDIVPTARLKWLAGSKWTAKDNTSWYRFDAHHTGPTVFHARAA